MDNSLLAVRDINHKYIVVDTDSEIVFGLENRAIPQAQLKARLVKTIAELNLASLKARNIFELSGGEKQKIAFASVYATRPEIFVLDEPSSNLDMGAVDELTLLLRTVKQQGKTMVIAEHRLWYLMDIADRVIYMKDGKIKKDMTVTQFKALAHQELFTMGLRCRELSQVAQASTNPCLSDLELKVENLTVHLGRAEVLKKICFTAHGGEILAIAGQNGAGKTTLARALCGLQKSEAGTVFLDGRPLSQKQRRNISYMVMQDVGHQLFTDSVEAECALGTKEPNKEKIAQALEWLNLTAYKDRHPLSLSGGQKQRLAVAVSMICEKELIIFDEPTSGLDLKSMQEVGRLARELSAQGKILLVITHDYEFIQSICSRILFLQAGEITDELTGEKPDYILEKLKGEKSGTKKE